MNRASTSRGFTLIELLVVLAVIGVLAAVILGGLSASNQSTLLQSGQTTLANAIALARNKSMTSGHRTRLIVNNDISDASRYRRTLAVIEAIPVSSGWKLLNVFNLPEGIYVIPHETRIGTGLLQDEASWTEFGNTNALDSRAFASPNTQNIAIDSSITQNWEYLAFTPAGTTANAGDVIIAVGRKRDPASIAQGLPPIELQSPDTVRGINLSYYGLIRLIDDRTGFQ